MKETNCNWLSPLPFPLFFLFSFVLYRLLFSSISSSVYNCTNHDFLDLVRQQSRRSDDSLVLFIYKAILYHIHVREITNIYHISYTWERRLESDTQSKSLFPVQSPRSPRRMHAPNPSSLITSLTLLLPPSNHIKMVGYHLGLPKIFPTQLHSPVFRCQIFQDPLAE